MRLYICGKSTDMFRYLFVAAFAICWLFASGFDRKGIVVADSATRVPLPSASVFGSSGLAIGKPTVGMPAFIPEGDYPVLVSYIGFEDKSWRLRRRIRFSDRKYS